MTTKSIIQQPKSKFRARQNLYWLSLAAFTLCTTPSVNADIKVTAALSVAATASDNSQDNTPAPPAATVVFSCKDGIVRIDDSSGRSTIFDARNKKVTVLNAADSTYYSIPLKDWQQLGAVIRTDPSSPPPKNDINAELDTTDDTPGNTRSMDAFTTRKFLLTGLLTSSASHKRQSGGDDSGGGMGDGSHGGILGSLLGGIMGGGHGGGGRGGGQGADAGDTGELSQETEVAGQLWLAHSPSFTIDTRDPIFAEAFMSRLAQGPLVETMAQKLEKDGGLPLYSRVTSTTSYPSGNDQGQTVELTVTDLVEDPLPDSLFQVPASYSEVSPPLPRAGRHSGRY